jgi:hypothetical protein
VSRQATRAPAFAFFFVASLTLQVTLTTPLPGPFRRTVQVTLAFLPAGPLAPVFPLAPAGPAAPTDPAAPAGPVAPVGPAGPTGGTGGADAIPLSAVVGSSVALVTAVKTAEAGPAASGAKRTCSLQARPGASATRQVSLTQ